jgi:hypothetical protein
VNRAAPLLLLICLAACNDQPDGPAALTSNEPPDAGLAPAENARFIDTAANDDATTPAEPNDHPPVMVRLIPPSQTTSPVLADESFITAWAVLGPFDASPSTSDAHATRPIDRAFVEDEAGLDATQTPPAGSDWRRRRFVDRPYPGRVDLDALYGGALDHVASYSVTWLDAPRPFPDATLHIGSDDHIRIWLNGKLIHTYDKGPRTSRWDQDTVKVALKEGRNRLVVKCVDVTGDYDFYARLTDGNARPIEIEVVRPARRK